MCPLPVSDHTTPASPQLMRWWQHAVVRQGLAVGFATGLYGISFGALAAASGLTVAQAVVLSALLFSGGSQFAVVGVVAAGGSGAAAVAASTLLGLRNAFYGLQTAPLLNVRSWRRVLAAHWTVDESAAVALGQRHVATARLGFWATGAAVFAFWNLMTLLGALLGNALGDPRRWGLDAAAGAAFLALLWPRLHSRVLQVTALGAGALTLAVSPYIAPGLPILVGALAALVAGSWPQKSSRSSIAAQGEDHA